MTRAIERLAAAVVAQGRRIDGLASGPQLAFSSIEDGALDEYDRDGTLVSTIGKQWDGTHGAVVLSGPVPPRPSKPVVSGGPGLLTYGWDGCFADDDGETDITIPAPMDFARTEAHASQVSGYTAESTDTLLDTMESPRGGSRTAMREPGIWYVVLVTRSTSGKRSAQSAEVTVEVLPAVGSDVDVEALRAEFAQADQALGLALAENQIQQDALSLSVQGLSDTTLPALDAELGSAKKRLDTARTELDRLTGVAPLPDVYAKHLAAATAAFQKADIGNLTVTGASALAEVVARKIAADAGRYIILTTDQLTAGTASIGTGVADRFFADIFGTRKLYANQVIIGHPGNILPDPMFMDDGMTARRNQNSTCTVALSPDNDLALTSTGTAYFRPLGVPQNAAGVSQWIAVRPGDVWKFEVTVVSWRVAGWMKFLGRTQDGGVYANPAASTTIPVGSGTYSLTATIPANCYWICPEMMIGAGGANYVKRGSMTMQQVITPSLVVDGLMNGQRIVGAFIETNLAAQRGVKILDTGLFAFDAAGNETLRFDGANSIITGAVYRTGVSGPRVQVDADGVVAHGVAVFKPIGGAAVTHNVRTILSHRQSKWGASATDKWPGLWFESVPANGSGAAPLWPAGFTTSNADAKAIVGRSAMAGALDTYSESVIAPGGASLDAYGPGSTSSADQSRVQSSVGVSPTGFNMGTVDQGGAYRARVSHTMDGVLQLYGVNGVNVNGTSIMPRSWTLIPMPTGRSALDGNRPAVRLDSTGEYFEFTGGVVMTAGTSTNPGVTFLSLPAQFRPPTFKNFVVATSAGPQGLTISSAGAIYLNPTGLSAGGWIDLSQLRYSVQGPR